MDKKSIRVTIGLIFGALILIGGLSVGFSLWTARAQQKDALIINLAGRQRMLSQKMSKEAWMGLTKGRDPHYLSEMHTTAHQFEEVLQDFLDGGELVYAGMIVRIPKATDPSFRSALEEVQVTWELLHQAAHTVLESEPGSAVFSQGQTDLEYFSIVVLGKMDEAVRRYQAATETRVARIKWIQLIFLFTGVIVMAVGYRLILARVLRPVSSIEKAVLRMEKGDLDHPLEIRVRNELGRLAEAFDHMRFQIKARMHEKTTLLRLSQGLINLADPKAIMDLAVLEVAKALQAELSAIALIDENGQTYSDRAGVGWPPEISQQAQHIPLSESTGLGYVMRIREPVVILDESRESRFETPPYVTRMGITSSLLVPMLVDNEPIGGMVVSSRSPRDFSDDEMYLLSLIANQTAVSLERAKEHQKVREAEARYRSLFDGVPVGLYRTTSTGEILDVNPAMVDMFGYKDRKSLMEANASHLYLDHEERRRWKELMDGEGTAHDFETQSQKRDGTVIWVRDSARVVRDDSGQVLFYEGCMEDITEQKRIDRMKDEFIATVSHELRTPLTSIHGSLNLISCGMAGDLPDQTKKLLDIAERNSARLKHLIEDLLDIRKIESGEMDFSLKPLELKRLVEVSLENNKSFGEQFNAEFVLEDVSPDIKVNADSDRLIQVMDNLLSNAAKFSPPDTTVKVSVSRHNGSVRVAVMDHGPGIPEEFHSRVFQKFTQADSSMTREKGGTGLGLSLARSIIEKHSGKIGFETKVGEGTTFYFDLPEWREAEDS